MIDYRKLNWDYNKISWIIAIEVAILMVIASFFLPGGDDLYRFYRPFAEGCLDCGFTPYFARWLLWPLTLIPLRLLWPFWSFVSISGFLIISRLTKVNPAILLLSFPALGQFWLGQIDVIICSGLVLALVSNNPYLRGLGISLALVKPQLAGFAVLLLLIHQSRRNIMKVILVPLTIFILSLLVFGITWPSAWLSNAKNDLPVHIWRSASRDIWPYGIFLMLTVFIFPHRRARVEASLLISGIATPFFSVYSYIVFLIFYAPWWSLPLSYAWFLMYPWWGNAAMRIAWILPGTLLGYLFYLEIKDQQKENSLRVDGVLLKKDEINIDQT